MNSNHRNHDLRETPFSAEEQQRIGEFISKFHEVTHEGADRPEAFWGAQRAMVRQRLATAGRKPLAWRAMASATAVVALGAILMLAPRSVNPTQQTASHNPGQTVAMDDEALLQSISDTATSEMPSALTPAAVLTAEIDRGIAKSSSKNGRTNQ